MNQLTESMQFFAKTGLVEEIVDRVSRHKLPDPCKEEYGYEVRVNGLWVVGGLVPTAKEALQIADHLEAFYEYAGKVDIVFYVWRHVGHDYLQGLAHGGE